MTTSSPASTSASSLGDDVSWIRADVHDGHRRLSSSRLRSTASLRVGGRLAIAYVEAQLCAVFYADADGRGRSPCVDSGGTVPRLHKLTHDAYFEGLSSERRVPRLACHARWPIL